MKEKDISLPILSYSTRLIASEVNLDRLVDISLDIFADFGNSDYAELLLLKNDFKTAQILGVLSQGNIEKSNKKINLDNNDVIQILNSKLSGIYTDPEKGELLCFPLIGTDNKPLGLLKLKACEHSPQTMMVLTILTTLVAISIENAQSFALATFDGLTGLYVRRHFDNKLNEEINKIKIQGGSLSLFLMDIDHFKKFNDTYGHQQGDMILRELADLLKKSVRNNIDIPCRYGGEEFVTILPVADINFAYDFANNFRKTCELHDFKGEDQVLKVTISGGISVINSDHVLRSEQMIQEADALLYKAKESGRNRVLANM